MQYSWPGGYCPPIPAWRSTALLVINSQYGYRDPSWGDGASNPDYEKNVSSLIAKFRSYSETTPEDELPLIIHAQLKPIWVNSPLYPGKTGPYGPTASLESANSSRSPSNEVIITCRGPNVFSNTPLESLLKKRNIRTLLVAGISTDHAVSTTVRSAYDLAMDGRWGGPGYIEDTFRWLHTDGAGVYGQKKHVFGGNQEVSQEDLVDYAVDMARIILIGDGTRCFGKGGVDADMVHRVHVESLNAFAEVINTATVLRQLYQDERWKKWTFS
ncbi:hypothetical protein TRIATDRAFT_41585 [Trichoderma atroviride IMI 206040]|uniref:Isochorismatase-like domain-containing protein n=1 Tax=Hypocrea atroviridis (strain ATCC 20476 / IMI 206040) TaxID=452589 RepID=G9PB16_HYPAI|nr:uncharacterized protein TRIATDRAFT_41585 [Trichoderma atroviride IMI 206040]EHK40197.1 hypothetical protein TRIATDRAFT_41585 [Trichoderma atroviride IMI 206040]